MTQSRLLVITPGIGKTGFGPEAAKELAEAAIADILRTAESLPPRLNIRVAVVPGSGDSHISGSEFVPLFRDGFSSGAESVCVVGANAPQIPLSYLLEAFGRLTPQRDRACVVAGPAQRMGWYLGGANRSGYETLTHPTRPLLKDIFAGVSNGFRESHPQAVAGELSPSLLPSLLSLETPSDGQRLLRDMRRGVAAAPRTQYTLRKLGFE